MIHSSPFRRASSVVRLLVRSRCPSTVDSWYRRRNVTVAALPEKVDLEVLNLDVDAARVTELLPDRLLLRALERWPQPFQRLDTSGFERLFVAPDEIPDAIFRSSLPCRPAATDAGGVREAGGIGAGGGDRRRRRRFRLW